MGVTLPELFKLAERGREITISSMCTVFAESKIVSLMGPFRFTVFELLCFSFYFVV